MSKTRDDAVRKKVLQIMEEENKPYSHDNTIQVIQRAEEYVDTDLALKSVVTAITTISKNGELRESMGTTNSKKLDDTITKMNDDLKGIKNQDKRAEVIIAGITKLDTFVQKVEKQNSTAKLWRVKNVLKASLKVVLTLGLNKSAKLEFSAAQFAMNNKDPEKLKSTIKSTSSSLKDKAKIARNTKKDTTKGMGR